MRKRITELVNQFLPDEEAHLTESDVMDLLSAPFFMRPF